MLSHFYRIDDHGHVTFTGARPVAETVSSCPEGRAGRHSGRPKPKAADGGQGKSSDAQGLDQDEGITPFWLACKLAEYGTATERYLTEHQDEIEQHGDLIHALIEVLARQQRCLKRLQRQVVAVQSRIGRPPRVSRN